MKNIKQERGQVIILALVFLVAILLMMGALLSYTSSQILSHKTAVDKEKGLNIAEAGVELAIWKLNNQAGYNGETDTNYGNGTFTVIFTNLSSSNKLVTVDAYVPNRFTPVAHRTVQLITSLGSTSNITFAYAIQSGQGGFAMDNNAKVTGNIYSNGPIVGANGTQITGDAVSVSSISSAHITGSSTSDTISNSTVGGSANHHSALSNTTVMGNVSANSISSCTISGTATYNSRTSCTVSGAVTTPNNNLPVIPSAIPLPIPDSQITAWEQEAAAGGTVGSQTIETASLGPKKINGNLVVNGTLTITGTIWVTGSITVNNGATVKLSSSYGNLTGVLIAGVSGSSTAGSITAYNNSILQGSGTEGSYLLLLSEMNNTAVDAITISNNALSAIIYARASGIYVSNNAQVREITGYKIHLNNNVTLTSTSGATNAAYFSSSSAGWQMVDQTWQLLK